MYTKKFITDGLNIEKPLIWDTETIGFYGQTRLIQVRQGSVSYVYDMFYINIEDVKHFFKDWYLVLHNGQYDLSCKQFIQWVPKKIDDTMVAARLTWPQWDSHSLAACAQQLNFGIKGDEGASDWSQWDLTEKQLEYAELDTLLTQKLYEAIPESTFKSQVYQLDIKSIMLACDYQYRGMPISKKECQRYKREHLKLIRSCKKLPEDLNVNSPSQVRKFLGMDVSDSDTLTLSDNPLCKEILIKRQSLKAISYIESLLPHRVACSITTPSAAKTGRFISKSADEIPGTFNLQQIPHEMKSLFGANKGYYVTADYPALEIWMATAITGEKNWHEALLTRADLHIATAMKMFNKTKEEVDKTLRTLAKLCNFTLLYGAGSKALAHSLAVWGHTEEAKVAADLSKQWKSAVSDISAWQRSIFEYFQSHSSKIVYTPLGRPVKAISPTQALNYPVQGGGAECTKLAIVLLDNNGIKICNTVHDSIALLASTMKEAEEYKDALSYAMDEAYRRVIKNCKANDLSLAVDVNINEYYT